MVIACLVLLITILVSPVSAQNDISSSFLYDGSGQRIARIDEGGEHTYYVSPTLEVTIKPDGSKTWRKTYPITGNSGALREGSSTNSTGTVYYAHSDHLGSTALVTASNGTAAAKQRYFPYGTTKSESGDLHTDREYTGQISDQDTTGLYYYNARYYDPLTAKFTQADSVNDGLNRYEYVGGNPINLIDPTGHSPIDEGPNMPPLNPQEAVDLLRIQFSLPYSKILDKKYRESNKAYHTYWGSYPEINSLQDRLRNSPVNMKSNYIFKIAGMLGVETQEQIFGEAYTGIPRWDDSITYSCNTYSTELLRAIGINDISHWYDPRTGNPTANEGAELSAGKMYWWLNTYGADHEWVDVSNISSEERLNYLANGYVMYGAELPVPPGAGYTGDTWAIWGTTMEGSTTIPILSKASGNHLFTLPIYPNQFQDPFPGTLWAHKLPGVEKDYIPFTTNGNGCFTGETQILLSNGDYKEIRHITNEDVVQSYNLSSDSFDSSKVTELIIHKDNPGGYYIINDNLKVTGEHLLWSVSNHRWIPVNELRVGETLLDSQGTNIKISVIVKIEGNFTVYNLHLDNNNHNFFANNILVHNRKSNE